MKCDRVNWSLIAPGEYVLWFRTSSRRNYWRIHGAGAKDICESLAAKFWEKRPKFSFLVLPRLETPILRIKV